MVLLGFERAETLSVALLDVSIDSPTGESRPLGSCFGPHIWEVIATAPRFTSYSARIRALWRTRSAEDDQLGKQQLAIVDESTARTFWPDRDPIGRCVSIGSAATNPPWRSVVGVLKENNRRDLASPKPSSGPTSSRSPAGFRPGRAFECNRDTKKSGQEDFSWPVNATRL
jgi:hypothetical protein